MNKIKIVKIKVNKMRRNKNRKTIFISFSFFYFNLKKKYLIICIYKRKIHFILNFAKYICS
jgi:hypothetical protein